LSRVCYPIRSSGPVASEQFPPGGRIMATARVPVAETLYDIQVDITGASVSPGMSILPTDRVGFTNNAPFPIMIKFICANGPVFSDVQSISSHSTSSAQTPQKTE